MSSWHSETRVDTLPAPVDAFKKKKPVVEPSPVVKEEEPVPPSVPELEQPALSDSRPTPLAAYGGERTDDADQH